MIERGDILGLIEIEEDELIPLTDDVISSVCSDTHNIFPEVKKKIWSRYQIEKNCHLQAPSEF
jgi:hypothetical protein